MSTIPVSSDAQVLPPRVRAAIAEQQDRSERLIGWVRLAIVLTFAVLYLLSRKMAVSYSIVTPAAIGIYLVLALVGLAMAYRSRLNGLMLTGSVLLDMLLLYGLIWSFPLQYMQPPSFYLKSPTLLYVFIFIALRALRFEVRYVVLAGLAAALGWLLMVGYVLYSDPASSMITRDYVHYMTSNSILLGAEFDKVISILVVTTIIAVAIARARRLMTKAVLEGQAKKNLSRFFSPEIAQDISHRGDEIMAGTGVMREAAILNLDLRGFTKMAAVRSPDEVVATLADYQRVLVPVIQRNGGSIDKFLGDGIMATFGATRARDDYAVCALRALEEVMEAAAAWSEQQQARGLAVSVNGSLASGRVICGAVGDETRLEYTVIGDAVNLSAKLEKHNKTLGSRAIATADTYERALRQGYRPKGECRRVDASAVGGVAQPVDLVIVA